MGGISRFAKRRQHIPVVRLPGLHPVSRPSGALRRRDRCSPGRLEPGRRTVGSRGARTGVWEILLQRVREAEDTIHAGDGEVRGSAVLSGLPGLLTCKVMRVTTIRYRGAPPSRGDPDWRIIDDYSWGHLSWVVLGVNTRWRGDIKTMARRYQSARRSQSGAAEGLTKEVSGLWGCRTLSFLLCWVQAVVLVALSTCSRRRSLVFGDAGRCSSGCAGCKLSYWLRWEQVLLYINMPGRLA